MKIHLIIFLIWIVGSFAEKCKETTIVDVIPWDHVINTAKTLLAFPGGLGPKQALGIGVVMQIYDLLDPFAQGTDPLDEFIERYEKELEENTLNIVQGFFKGEVFNTREIEASYKEIYDLWVKNGMPREEPKYNSMHSFFSFASRQHIESGINKIIGNTNFNYYGVPMFSVMGTAYLGILRDAIFIGNDYLGIPANGLSNYRSILQKRMNMYTQFLQTVHTNRLKQLDTLEKKLVYETTNILEAFDIAAQWTMFIPTSNQTIPVDVVFTRPVYSKVTECLGSDSECKIDIASFEKEKGLAEDFGFPTHLSYENVKWTDSHIYTGFKSVYSDGHTYKTPDFTTETKGIDTAGKLITNIKVRYAKSNGLNTQTVDACRIPGPTHAKYCDANDLAAGKEILVCQVEYCGRYPTQILFGNEEFGPTPYQNCYVDGTDIQVPKDHALTRIISAQHNGKYNYRWVFEFRHIPKRLNFDGVTSNRAIRFPGEYVMHHSKIEQGGFNWVFLDEINYLMGGRVLKITATNAYLTFTLPQKTTYIRVYAKGRFNITGCNLQKHTFKFDNFDLYEGKCTKSVITISSAANYGNTVYIGAVEAIYIHPVANTIIGGLVNTVESTIGI